MVIDERIQSTALMRYRLGSVLIALGVLTWLPFIVLRIAGEQPSLLWYLPFHLLGVIGGSRLRALARREMNIPPAKKSPLQMIGHTMILVGVFVWAPYFYLKVIHQSVDVMDYLPFHLTGILGGVTLLVVNYWISRKNEGKV